VLGVGDGLGGCVGVGTLSSVGGGVGRGAGTGAGGGFVGGDGAGGSGVGAAVGCGVGAGVGVGGGSVTVTIGPGSGSGCGSLEVVAWKVTCQVPAGSVAGGSVAGGPCQVPSWALPLTLMSATVTPPTSAQTAWAGRTGLSVEV
jgi:hypothetical protein